MSTPITQLYNGYLSTSWNGSCKFHCLLHVQRERWSSVVMFIIFGVISHEVVEPIFSNNCNAQLCLSKPCLKIDFQARGMADTIPCHLNDHIYWIAPPHQSDKWNNRTISIKKIIHQSTPDQ